MFLNFLRLIVLFELFMLEFMHQVLINFYNQFQVWMIRFNFHRNLFDIL